MRTPLLNIPVASRLCAASLALLFFLITACATSTTPSSKRTHSDLSNILPSVKRVVILPPKVEVYEISAGGVSEKMDDWSNTATQHLMAAIQNHLSKNDKTTVSLLLPEDVNESVRDNLRETQALYDVVNNAIVTHTHGYPANRFEEKVASLDYTLGSEVSELHDEADAYLIIRALDQISTGGRKTEEVTKMVALAVLGVSYVGNWGMTMVSLGLVDAKTGNIIWYDHQISRGEHDLRDPVESAGFITDIFVGLPGL